MAVVDHIHKLAQVKSQNSADVLRDVADMITNKQVDRGPIPEILDLAASLTGYMTASIPGGESRAALNLIATVLQYMTLRAQPKSDPTATEGGRDPIISTLHSLVLQSAELYAETALNTTTPNTTS